MGYLNYDISDDIKRLPLIEFSQDMGLLVCLTDHIQSVNNSQSKLDIVLTKTLSNIMNWSLAPTPLFASHHPISLTYKFLKTILSPRYKITRSFKRCNLTLLNQDLTRNYKP